MRHRHGGRAGVDRGQDDLSAITGIGVAEVKSAETASTLAPPPTGNSDVITSKPTERKGGRETTSHRKLRLDHQEADKRKGGRETTSNQETATQSPGGRRQGRQTINRLDV